MGNLYIQGQRCGLGQPLRLLQRLQRALKLDRAPFALAARSRDAGGVEAL